MDLNTALVILIVGALVGLLSGLIAKAKGKGFSPVVHMIVGIIGAFHGRPIFSLIDIRAHGTLGNIIIAAVCAILFVYPLRFIRPA